MADLPYIPTGPADIQDLLAQDPTAQLSEAVAGASNSTPPMIDQGLGAPAPLTAESLPFLPESPAQDPNAIATMESPDPSVAQELPYIDPMPQAQVAGGVNLSATGTANPPTPPGVDIQPLLRAIDEKTEVEKYAMVKENEVLQAKQEELARVQHEEAKRQQLYDEDLANTNHSIQSAIEEKKKLINQGVDPARFWNNQNAAQKAFSLIAGFCFGYVGKGMDYLGRLDQLVRDDVSLQMQEKDTKIKEVEGRISNQINQRDWLRQKGIDDKTATQAEMLLKYQGFEAKIEQFKNTTKSADAIARAEEMKVGLQQRQQGIAQNMAESASLMAHRKVLEQMDRARLGLERERLGVQRQGMKQEGQKQISDRNATIIRRHAAAQNVLIGLNRVKELMNIKPGALGVAGDIPYAIGQEIAGLFPGTDVSTAQDLQTTLASELAVAQTGTGTESARQEAAETIRRVVGLKGRAGGGNSLDELISQLEHMDDALYNIQGFTGEALKQKSQEREKFVKGSRNMVPSAQKVEE